LSTVTGTTTNRTVTTTASQTITMTSYMSTVITSTSIYTVTGATPPTPPPIPGFPLESILAGLGLGLLGVHLVFRNRRANRKRPS
jgi:carbohydrate-binding DOMON domain-containing protein